MDGRYLAHARPCRTSKNFSMSADKDNDSGTAMARGRTGAVSASREQEWLILLKLAAEEVFEIMCGNRLVAATTPEPSPGENFTAMVGLAGSLRGVVTVYCGADSARHIAMRLLRSEAVCTNDQVCDAMGEICNMVAGNFKNKITGLDGPCLLSVPA